MTDVRGARTLGLDVGDKTIGVAWINDLGWVTSIETIRRTAQVKDLARILVLCEEREIIALVVGLPLNMDGSEGPRALKSRRFAAAAREALRRPVVLHDERLSTFEASRRLHEAGLDARRQKAMIDQVAAEVILQSWLDAGASLAETTPAA